MTVDLVSFPAECSELGSKIARVADIRGLAVDLKAVAVDDGDKVVQVAMGSEHCGFPNLTLLALAITEQGEDGVVVAGKLHTACHAAGDGKTLTKRTGGNLDAGQKIHIGVTLKARSEFTKRGQFFLGEVARLGKRSVQRRSRMTLGEDEAIAILVLGIRRVVLHRVEIKHRQNVRA